MKTRHPEKINTSDKLSPLKPNWLKVRFKSGDNIDSVKEIVKNNKVHTVCEEANCPNLSECWSKKHATFMIMGDTCTRACTFCNVKTGKPNYLDPFEHERVATSVSELGLTHVVITSVNRDDLTDGGAKHFREVIEVTKKNNKNTTIEVLTPDFLRKGESYKEVIKAKPDVFNHNLETVPRLYPTVRPGSRYFHSLKLLEKVKELDPTMFTKSGLMVGLGESLEEVYQVMDDMRSADIDFLTVGQYLQPSVRHHPLDRFIEPKEFNEIETRADGKGFSLVSASPLTRSSYHAGEDFKALRDARERSLNIEEKYPFAVGDTEVSAG